MCSAASFVNFCLAASSLKSVCDISQLWTLNLASGLQTEKKTFAEEVNAAMREAADGPMKNILCVCDEPLVSIDFKQTFQSSTIDASLTMVMGDDMVKIVAWYDNEWGYSQRVVDLAELTASKWE